MVFKLITAPANLIGSVIDKVMFPMMAIIQQNKKEVEKLFFNSMYIVSLVLFPVSALIWFYSKEIVFILLGSKWSEAIVPLQILGLSLVFRTSYKISDSLSRATGNVYRRAFIQLVYAIMVLVGSIYGSRFGIIGVSIATSISIFLNYIFMLMLSLSILETSSKKYIILNIQFTAVLLLNVVVFYFLKHFIYIESEILNLITGIILFFFISTTIYYYFFKKEIINSIQFFKAS
jgi:PST family polysaccharide transporter